MTDVIQVYVKNVRSRCRTRCRTVRLFHALPGALLLQCCFWRSSSGAEPCPPEAPARQRVGSNLRSSVLRNTSPPPSGRRGSRFSPGVSDRGCPLRTDPRLRSRGRVVRRRVEQFARGRWRPRGAGGGLPPGLPASPRRGTASRGGLAPQPAFGPAGGGGTRRSLPRSPRGGTRRPLVASFGGAFSFVTAAKELGASRHRCVQVSSGWDYSSVGNTLARRSLSAARTRGELRCAALRCPALRCAALRCCSGAKSCSCASCRV